MGSTSQPSVAKVWSNRYICSLVISPAAGCGEVVLERLPYVQDCGVLAPFDLVDVGHPVGFTILLGGVETMLVPGCVVIHGDLIMMR